MENAIFIVSGATMPPSSILCSPPMQPDRLEAAMIKTRKIGFVSTQ
jgi:hypothetical protein